MGAETFYDGRLSDQGLQIKVIQLVSSYYLIGRGQFFILYPNPNIMYLTSYHRKGSVKESTWDAFRRHEGPIRPVHLLTKDILESSRDEVCEYPFDFYGIMPICIDGNRASIFEQEQFIFDRSSGGSLVTLEKLPESYGIPFWRDMDPVDKTISNPQGDNDIQVIFREGGNRRPVVREFSLLLNLISLRYWPDIDVSDDLGSFELIHDILVDSKLDETFKDESINFYECSRLFSPEYEKRCPR